MAQGRRIFPTVLSRMGHFFMGPGGEKYKNLGKIFLKGTNESGAKISMGFHVAEGVGQPLGSIASANDGDTMAVFDSARGHHGSKLIRAESEVGRQIRDLVAKAEGTEMRRIKNTYYARLWLDEDDDGAPAHEGFPGRES